MSKFKVGDRVIANKKAGDYPGYAVTIPGWRGHVVRVINDRLMEVEGPSSFPGNKGNYVVISDCFDLVHDFKKIVVTTDGKTTTARLFNGKDLVKSVVAKCSPQDKFVFETGAALALDRLLDREQKTETPKFPFDKLTTGMFGRFSDGDWFVVVGGNMVYERGSWDKVADFINDGKNIHGSIDCLVEAVSFRQAKRKAECRHCLWVRDGVKF